MIKRNTKATPEEIVAKINLRLSAFKNYFGEDSYAYIGITDLLAKIPNIVLTKRGKISAAKSTEQSISEANTLIPVLSKFKKTIKLGFDNNNSYTSPVKIGDDYTDDQIKEEVEILSRISIATSKAENLLKIEGCTETILDFAISEYDKLMDKLHKYEYGEKWVFDEEYTKSQNRILCAIKKNQ